MIRFSIAAALLLAALDAAAQSYLVPPELWDRPRSGKAVLEQPAVRQAVAAYLAQPGSRMVLRHGPGPESLLAAEELRAWLAALAIDAARMELRGDLKPAEPLTLEIVRE